MMFSKGKGSFSDPKHIRRTRAYLDEARMAMLEHSVAAEHYQALTAMYAQRIKRLEQEIAEWELRTEAASQAQTAPNRARQSVSSGVVMPLSGGESQPDPMGGRRQAA